MWDELPNGGRCYYRLIRGKVAGYAHYVKIVDADEVTLSIVQEVYDDNGHLIALHEKYPVDKGHQNVDAEEESE